MRRAIATILTLALLAGADAAAAAPPWSQPLYPSAKQLRQAKAFASSRAGAVSFAVIGARGAARGADVTRPYSSASLTKALLLAAYLRSHRGPIDPGVRAQLSAMVRASDNDAAGAIYAIVGDAGLNRAAARAGMRDFDPTPGFWGGAQVTAADMARFFARLDRNLAGPHRRYGKDLLASVIGPERWGMPEAIGKGWRIWFKGGWRPGDEENTSGPVTHQAGLLRCRGSAGIGIAVLTDQPPGGDVYETIEGIARRLTHPAPPAARWPAT